MHRTITFFYFFLFSASYVATLAGVKVLVNIAAYESHNNSYLVNILKIYQHMCTKGYDVRVIIHTTDHWDSKSTKILQDSFNYNLNVSASNQCTVELDEFPKDITLGLANQHRNTIRQYKNDYDLFIYQEDDMKIELHHIEEFIQHSQFLKQSITYIVGFLRYEILKYDNTINSNGVIDISSPMVADLISGDYKYMFDVPLPQFHLRSIDGRPYLMEVYNPHQAMWILTKEQLLQLDTSCGFLTQHNLRLKDYRMTREYVSSYSIFRANGLVSEALGITGPQSCNVTKVIPWKNFQSFGIHHMRQRYVQNVKHIKRSLALVEAVVRNYVRKTIDEDMLSNGIQLSQLSRETLKSFELET